MDFFRNFRDISTQTTPKNHISFHFRNYQKVLKIFCAAFGAAKTPRFPNCIVFLRQKLRDTSTKVPRPLNIPVIYTKDFVRQNL